MPKKGLPAQGAGSFNKYSGCALLSRMASSAHDRAACIAPGLHFLVTTLALHMKGIKKCIALPGLNCLPVANRAGLAFPSLVVSVLVEVVMTLKAVYIA